jgi:hypothetical protein
MVASRWLEPDVETHGHATKRRERGFERASPGDRHGKAAGAAPAALRGGLAFVGAHESFVLEPRQRLVDGAECEVAPGQAHDLVVDGNAVSGVADAEDGEKDDLFEFAEHGLDGIYLIDNVENMSESGVAQDCGVERTAAGCWVVVLVAG